MVAPMDDPTIEEKGPRFPDEDHSVAAAEGNSRQILAPRRPILPLGALRQRAQEKKESHSALQDNLTNAETNVRPRNRPERARRYKNRGLRRPLRVRTRTHLDYRRPVSFKFKRTSGRKRLKPRGEESIHGQGVQFRHSTVNKHDAAGKYNDVYDSTPSLSLDPQIHFNEKPALKSSVATAASPGIYEETQRNIPKPKVTRAEPSSLHNRLEPEHTLGRHVPHLSHPIDSKSAKVPGWLMDLKTDPRHPTPVTRHHISRDVHPKKIVSSSPRPADFALSAIKKSVQPPHSHHTIHSATLEHHKSSTFYGPPSIPDHFRIISPGGVNSHTPVPPPKIHAPIDTKSLPVKYEEKTEKNLERPHYPVIPSPNPSSGSKYSVQVTTPAGVYVTPIKVTHSPPHKLPHLSVYAPPTSPKPSYGPPQFSPHHSLLSSKPHIIGINPHPHKAHIGQVEGHRISHQISSQAHISHLTPVKEETTIIKADAGNHHVSSHHVIVTPKTHHVTVTPKSPKQHSIHLLSTLSADKKTSKDYGAAIVPNKYVAKVQSAPVKSVAQEVAYHSDTTIKDQPKIKVTTYTPPVYTPTHPLDTKHLPGEIKQLKAGVTADELRQSEISLVPYVFQDIHPSPDYEDYFDYYEDFDSYYDDDYDYDYLPGVFGVAAARPPLPLHLLPDVHLNEELQSFGYIAGVPGE